MPRRRGVQGPNPALTVPQAAFGGGQWRGMRTSVPRSLGGDKGGTRVSPGEGGSLGGGWQGVTARFQVGPAPPSVLPTVLSSCDSLIYFFPTKSLLLGWFVVFFFIL